MIILYPLLRKLPIRMRMIAGAVCTVLGAVALVVGLVAVSRIIVDGGIVLALGAVLLTSAWRSRRVGDDGGRTEAARRTSIAR